MNHSTLRKLAWRRGAGALGLAVLALALPACKSGSSQSNRPSVSTEILGAGGGAGPDNTGGTGGTNPITGQVNPNDVVLASDNVLMVVDGVGRDQTTAQLSAGGTPFQTIIGPTGGNIVDLEIPGQPNDQMGISGSVASGIINLGNPASPSDDVRNNPFSNLIANFEIITDTSPDIVGAFGDLGLNSAGLPTDLTTPAARRLVVRGVILNTSGTANCAMPGVVTGQQNFVGAGTATVSQIQASGVGGQVPPRVFENLVGGTPVVVNSLGLPLIVTTVYTLHRSPSRFVSLSTTIVNPTSAAGGIPQPVFINQIVQLIQTGADSRNLDVFVPAPTFFTPMASLLPFPTGIAPYLSIVGRDEPGVSYTLWDTVAGQILVQRIGGVAAGGGQLPRTNPASVAVGGIPPRGALPITPLGSSPGPLNWVRHLAVGDRNDAESSVRTAIREIQRSPLRFIPGTSPAVPLPNGVNALVEIGGSIEGGGAQNALIQVFEISPAIFLNPLNGALQTSSAPILRTTVRPDQTGDWLALVPAGFSVGDVVDPATGAVLVDNSSFRTGTSRYGVRVLLPGRAPIPPTPGDFASIIDVARGNAVFDEPLYQARPIQVNEGLGASFSFMVQDENGAPLPAKITIKGTGSTPNPEIGFPTGLAAFSLDPTTGSAVPIDPGLTFERAVGGGNVVYSLTGSGTIGLPIPPPLTSATFEVVASHGGEYEIEGTAASGVQQITVGPNDVTSAVFTLRQVSNLPRRAISGDFHVHASNSPDSSVPPADKAVAYAATGVDILCSTEHDSLFDFEPTIGGLGLGNRLVSIVGTESTALIAFNPFTQSIGHYNAFPMQMRPLERKNGAPEDEFRPAWLLFGQLRLQDGTAGNEIIQINHPRGDVPQTQSILPASGFFEALSPATPAAGFPTEPGGLTATSGFFCAFGGVQPTFGAISASGGPNGLGQTTGSLGARAINVLFNGRPLTDAGTATGGATGAALIQAGVALGGPNQTQAPAGSLGFDTIEVLNGTQDATDYLQTRGDWFNLLNLGVIRVATSNTDSHNLRAPGGLGGEAIGHPKTYLLVPDPTVGAVRADPSVVVTALRPSFNNPGVIQTAPGGTVVVDNTTVAGAGAFRGQSGRTTLGKAFCTTGGFLNVAVFRQTADVREAQAFTIGDFPSLTGFDATVDVVVTVTSPQWVPINEVRLVVNGSVVAVIANPMSLGVTTFTATFNNVPVSATNGLGMAADSWLVVEAGQTLTALVANTLPGGRFNDVVPGGFSVAFSNPVFIDNPGTTQNVFDPPGNGSNN